MKRTLWIIIMIFSSVGVCFLSSYFGKISNPTEQEQIGTVYEEEMVQPKGFQAISALGREIVNADSYIEIHASMRYPADTDSQFKYAEDVIRGKIVGTKYFVFESIPWTQLKIECLEKFKGNLAIGSVVTVYVMGGYIEAEEYEQEYGECSLEKDMLVEMDFYQDELSDIGDEGVFFLAKNDKDSIFSNKTYSFLCSGYSKFMYDDKTNDIQVYNQSEQIEKMDQKDFITKMRKRKKNH